MHIRSIVMGLNGTNNLKRYHIDKSKYNIKKDWCIKLNKIEKIPINNLEDILFIMKKGDIKQVQKRLNILKRIGIDIKYNFDLDIYPSTGDIVEIEDIQYYILKSKKKYIYCCRAFNNIIPDKLNYKEVIVGGYKYYINENEIKKFLNSKDYKMTRISI